ncbi:MAG: 30S ribosomal protein S3 [Candidatus Thermoplasmatota archaeon]|jgi:small subunit ribosomal protein S3|nr:30S ribosomal protein S3 [Candidatus Thermoplasmatota archaeon]
MASERKFVAENIRRVLLKEYFMKETETAGFGGIDIQRTPMGTRVTLIVERPGMVIGRKGTKIKDLTRTVSEVYGFDNPQIEVQECKDASTNPQIMAQKLALALERGWHFRRAGHSTLRRIIDANVKGAQVKLAGKLSGQRHRTEKFKWGHIKFCGEPAIISMERGFAVCKKKLGVIGVSVDIMRRDAHLPDEIIYREMPDLGDVAKIEGELPSELTSEVVVVQNGSIQSAEVVTDAPEGQGLTDDDPKHRSKRKQKRDERRKTTEDLVEDGQEPSSDGPRPDDGTKGADDAITDSGSPTPEAKGGE